MYDSDHAEVSQVEITGMEKSVMDCIDSNHFQTLGKTLFGLLHIIWRELYLKENIMLWKIPLLKS